VLRRAATKIQSLVTGQAMLTVRLRHTAVRLWSSPARKPLPAAL